jgi:hypothetical protein
MGFKRLDVTSAIAGSGRSEVVGANVAKRLNPVLSVKENSSGFNMHESKRPPKEPLLDHYLTCWLRQKAEVFV